MKIPFLRHDRSTYRISELFDPVEIEITREELLQILQLEDRWDKLQNFLYLKAQGKSCELKI